MIDGITLALQLRYSREANGTSADISLIYAAVLKRYNFSDEAPVRLQQALALVVCNNYFCYD